MNDFKPVAGYRIVGDRKPDRQLSTGYLQMSAKAAELQNELWKRAPGGVDEKGNEVAPANCLNDPRFTSDDLMTDREAQLACAGCPVLQLCRAYAEADNAAWGTHGGKVYGRGLQKAMQDD